MADHYTTFTSFTHVTAKNNFITKSHSPGGACQDNFISVPPHGTTVIWRPGCALLQAQLGMFENPDFRTVTVLAGRFSRIQALTPHSPGKPMTSPRRSPGWINRLMHEALQRTRLQRSLLCATGERERPPNLPPFLQRSHITVFNS